MYNLTNLTNSQSIFGLVSYTNEITAGVMFLLFILAIFFVMLMVMKKWDFDSALLTSSFICFILSSLLAYSGLLTIIVPISFLTIAALTAFYTYTIKDR